MDWEVWGPPLVVLGVSSIVAIGIVLSMKSDQTTTGREAELVARKDQLLEALRELDADQPKMSGAAYQEQREVYLSEASQVLAALDGVSDTSVEPKEPLKVSKQVWAYVIGSLAFFGLLGTLIVEYSAPRKEGGIMTGASMEELQSADPQSMFAEWDQLRDDRQKEARAALEQNPEDLDALNMLTYEALLVRDMQSAMTFMERVRAIDEKDPDFMVHLAILQMTVGMTDRSETGFTLALSSRPGMPKALLWKGYMLSATNKKIEALKVLQSIEHTFSIPEEQYFYEGLLSDLNKPPALISGTVEAEGTLPKGTLFVIARRTPDGGMPVAVQKVSNPTFPMSFELGLGDMMMGGEWPEQVWLEVRLDEDGNAMTKENGDVTSEMQGPLLKSSHGLSVLLQGTAQVSESVGTTMLSGTITGEGLPSGTVFIIARRSPTGGMPAAVKKIEKPSFPLTFELGPSNMMMGGEWPEQVWLEVRLDEDGNAMTKGDGDVTSDIQGPLAGSHSDLQIQLVQ